jgi:three-Cys-motif partner protein
VPKALDPQGQSEIATEMKQRGLSYAFQLNYRVARKHTDWMPPYLHIDLNPGNGYNDKAGCVGSPITFLRIFEDRVDFRAIFVDHDVAQLNQLQSRLLVKDNPRCILHHGDNGDYLLTLPRQIPNRKWQLGSILSDPNGSDVPIDEIAEICKIFPKIDVMFHWNSTITKRLKYGIKPEQIVLEDVPSRIRKDHWLIREPITQHQFTMLIGRNFRGDEWRKGGFYHLDSPEGQAVMDRCSRLIRDREGRTR